MILLGLGFGEAGIHPAGIWPLWEHGRAGAASPGETRSWWWVFPTIMDMQVCFLLGLPRAVKLMSSSCPSLPNPISRLIALEPTADPSGPVWEIQAAQERRP